MTQFRVFWSACAVITLLTIGACSSAPSPRVLVDSPFLTGMKPEMQHFLEASKPNRTVGSPGHQGAFEYLKKQFDTIAGKSGGKVYVEEFLPDVGFAVRNYQKDFDTLIKPKYSPTHAEYKKWKKFTDGAIHFVQKFKDIPGKNLILEIPGKRLPNEVLYVGAHYDTITHNHQTLQFNTEAPAPGADDNASAVVALLAAARQVSQSPHDMTIRFVLFDYEEIFFLGSYDLAKNLSSMKYRWIKPDEKVVGLYNLEMIGWSTTDLKQNPVFKIYTRPGKAPGAESDLELAKAVAFAATQVKAQVKPVIVPNGFDRSDNWSFWQWSFPAVCISEDWEKDFNEANYHTSNDTISTLNFGYLKEIALTVIEAINLTSRDMMKPSFEDQTPEPVPTH